MREYMTRFAEYMVYKDLNDNVVTNECELSHGLLSQARAGKSDLGKKTIDKLLRKYRDLNRTWFLTGEGNMLNEDPDNGNVADRGCPYYGADFLGGSDVMRNDKTIVPEYRINFPPLNAEGVVWCSVTGHGMEPDINHGDVMALKEVVDWRQFIEYGGVYVIECANGLRMMRIVRKGGGDTLRLVPVNTRDHDEQELALDSIARMYKVLAVIKRF